MMADDPGVEAPLKGFHARIVREEARAGNEKLPIINKPAEAAGIQVHFAAIRWDMEFGKLVKDEGKNGLVVRKGRDLA